MSDRETLFGTDGIRDLAGRGLLVESSVRRISRAIAAALDERERFPDEFPAHRGREVFIARDTRASGREIAAWIAAELRSAGFDTADLGVLPTPGAAHAARTRDECTLAIVISASHNPAEFNGIKLLAPIGAKSSDAFETAVTSLHAADAPRRTEARAGVARDLARSVADGYVDWLASRCQRPDRLAGRSVSLDTANGAACRIAERVFQALDMRVSSIGAEPDGQNINRGCGALEPRELAARVVADGAVAGFCFDGDADRMIPITGCGTILDGDYVLALAGRYYKSRGRLPKETVVATVMSNVGLERALAREGIRLHRTSVGDKNVYRELLDGAHPVGGEQSGHLIFLDEFPTGDGLLAALRLLDFLESDDLDLEGEAGIMTRFPQVLTAVHRSDKTPIDELPAVVRAIRDAESELGTEGRVVVRYSGTEPIARVMVEGPDASRIAELAARIGAAFESRH